MKNFRDLYLIGISFIAGVLFVIQCGGGVSSIAEAVAEALDINFDNSGSSLETSNVQDALSELDARFPVVFDASSTPIGVLTTANPDFDGWEIWSTELQAFLYLNPSDGSVVYDADGEGDTHVYYETNDCTGDPYILMTTASTTLFNVVRIGDSYYVPANRGSYLTGVNDNPPTEILSKKDNNGSCTTEIGSEFSFLRSTTIEQSDLQITLIEARELSLPDYIGPLSFGRHTST